MGALVGTVISGGGSSTDNGTVGMVGILGAISEEKRKKEVSYH